MDPLAQQNYQQHSLQNMSTKILTAADPELDSLELGVGGASLLATWAREIGIVPLEVEGLRRLMAGLEVTAAGAPSLYLLPLIVVTTLFLPGVPTIGDVEMLSPSPKVGWLDTTPWIQLSDSTSQSLMIGILLLLNIERAVFEVDLFVIVSLIDGCL